MSMLSTGITALNAFRSQLVTTSNNVANVNTEGYNKQVVNLATLPSDRTSVGSVGSGVTVTDVKRQFDQYLMDRVRVHTSSNEDFQVYLDRSKRVDDIIADPDAGLSQALQDFFNATQDLADDPSSTATRSVLLGSANILSDRFHSVHEFLESMRGEINQDIKVLVNEVNTLAGSIASINNEIQVSIGSSGGKLPNDLLDRRDLMVNKLSQLVSVQTVTQSDQSLSVFIGNGQGLVIGSDTFELSTQINPKEPDRLDLTLKTGGGTTGVITDFLTGGKLGGFFRFRSNVLDSTENAIGRLAMGLGTAFNDQNKLGMDLNGALGVDMFTVPDATDATDVFGQQILLKTQGNATITQIDVTELGTADYELKFDGSLWTLKNRETGVITTPIPSANIITFGGVNNLAIKMDVSGAVANDQYIIRPTRLAARAFNVELTDARQIAAASPVSVSATSTNTGTTSISNSGLSSVIAAPNLLTLPVTLTFNATGGTGGNGAFNLSTGGSIDYNPATASGSTLSFSIANLGTFRFDVKGTPANGDVFTFGNNTGAVGDNRNARQLANLQTKSTMIKNSAGQATASFVNLYSELIGDVGSKTRQADINNETQIRLKEQAVSSFDEVSGVNLDEEAANLVQFQQAYQAASQVIRVSNTLFDTLLNAVG